MCKKLHSMVFIFVIFSFFIINQLNASPDTNVRTQSASCSEILMDDNGFSIELRANKKALEMNQSKLERIMFGGRSSNFLSAHAFAETVGSERVNQLVDKIADLKLQLKIGLEEALKQKEAELVRNSQRLSLVVSSKIISQIESQLPRLLEEAAKINRVMGIIQSELQRLDCNH